MSAAHETALQALADGYRVTLTDGQLRAYMLGVADLDAEDLAHAVVDLIRAGGRYLPRPGEVRRAVLDLERVEPPDVGEAWAEVCDQIRAVGGYGTPAFSHPHIGQAVRYCGGWAQLCRSENPGADQYRFEATYGRLVERAEREQLLAPGLAGACLRALPGSRYRLQSADLDDDSKGEGADDDGGGW